MSRYIFSVFLEGRGVFGGRRRRFAGNIVFGGFDINFLETGVGHGKNTFTIKELPPSEFDKRKFSGKIFFIFIFNIAFYKNRQKILKEKKWFTTKNTMFEILPVSELGNVIS